MYHKCVFVPMSFNYYFHDIIMIILKKKYLCAIYLQIIATKQKLSRKDDGKNFIFCTPLILIFSLPPNFFSVYNYTLVFFSHLTIIHSETEYKTKKLIFATFFGFCLLLHYHTHTSFIFSCFFCISKNFIITFVLVTFISLCFFEKNIFFSQARKERKKKNKKTRTKKRNKA